MKKFDYIESDTGEGSIFGISLKKTKDQKKKPVEESIYGTWEDMEKQLAAEADPSTGYGTDFFRKDTAHLLSLIHISEPTRRSV